MFVFRPPTPRLLALLTCCLVLVPIVGIRHAEGQGILANFDDGNTSSEVDGYPGMAGDGWTGPWTLTQNDAQVTVTDSDPLTPGSGNYLSATIAAGDRQDTLYRQYDSFGNVDLSQPHWISFDFRADNLDAFFDDPTTWIRLVSSDTTNPNDGNHRYWVGARTGAENGNWGIRDGDRAGNVTVIDTGIPVEQGVTYSFLFHIIPETSSYYGTIISSNPLHQTFESGLLGFRSGVTTGGTTMVFNIQKANNTGTINELMEFSLDNVAIVPEPGTVLLGLSAFMLLAMRRSR